MKVGRRETFCAAHRLFKKDWDDNKNRAVFGKCSNPNYHGHNYVLEVWVDGEIDKETGFVIDLKELKSIINSEIIERFDHRNLNLDCPEFQSLIPTTENIAFTIWHILRKKIDTHLELEVHLSETEKNKVKFNGR